MWCSEITPGVAIDKSWPTWISQLTWHLLRTDHPSSISACRRERKKTNFIRQNVRGRLKWDEGAGGCKDVTCWRRGFTQCELITKGFWGREASGSKRALHEQCCAWQFGKQTPYIGYAPNQQTVSLGFSDSFDKIWISLVAMTTTKVLCPPAASITSFGFFSVVVDERSL